MIKNIIIAIISVILIIYFIGIYKSNKNEKYLNNEIKELNKEIKLRNIEIDLLRSKNNRINEKLVKDKVIIDSLLNTDKIIVYLNDKNKINNINISSINVIENLQSRYPNSIYTIRQTNSF